MINDIDQPLYKFGLIYIYDFKSSYRKSYNKQKLRNSALFSFLVFNLFRLIACIKLLDNNRVPDYCLDFIQEMGGLTIYSYFSGLILSIMCLRFSFKLNIANVNDLKWIKIIYVLKGVLPVQVLDIKDKNTILKLISPTKRINIFIKITSKVWKYHSFYI